MLLSLQPVAVSTDFQNDTFEKITIKVTGVVLIELSFFTVCSKLEKIKMNTWNTISSSYFSKIWSIQNKRVLLLPRQRHEV